MAEALAAETVESWVDAQSACTRDASWSGRAHAAWGQGPVPAVTSAVHLPTDESKDQVSTEWTGAVRSVGFRSSDDSSSTTGSSVCSASSASSLVTVKSVSPTLHELVFHSRDTGRLIGKGGKNLKHLDSVLRAATKTSGKTKGKTKGSAIEVDRRHGGQFRVRCTEVAAKAVAKEMRRLLEDIHCHTVQRGQPFSSSSPAAASATTKKSTDPKVKRNCWALLEADGTSSEEEEEQEVLDPTVRARRAQEEEERRYEIGSMGEFAWVRTRLALTATLEASLRARPPTRAQKRARHVGSLHQDLLVHLLSFMGGPAQAIAAAAAVFTVDRRAALCGVAHGHRVWKALSARAFPDRALTTTQPHLYSFAAALHQQQLEPLGGTAAEVATDCRSMTLEFTTNPRTKRVDAAVAHMSVGGGVSSLCNDVVIVPIYVSSRHWQRHHGMAVMQLARLGRLGHDSATTTMRAAPSAPVDRKTNWRAQGLAEALASSTAKTAKSSSRPSRPNKPASNGAACLAPLRPLLVAVKTAFVKACDGAGLDLDAFVALWRLALALTDPCDRSPGGGAARYAAVRAQAEGFVKGQLEPDDLGNLVASLVCLPPDQWRPVLLKLLHLSMAKNVKWMCRALALAGHHEWIGVFKRDGTAPPLTLDERDAFLKACFEAGAVSRRIVLFWRSLQQAVAATGFLTPKAESLHGFRPTPALRRAMDVRLASVMAVDSWAAFFDALGGLDGPPAVAGAVGGGCTATAPTQAELVELLQRAWDEGVHRGYFDPTMDFSQLHANGTSSIFLVGQSYDKAAFCLDRSLSMSCPCTAGAKRGQRTVSRFDAVCTHLLNLLDDRSVDFSFAVVLFDHDVLEWKGGRLVQNTPQVRRELKTFLARNGPEGGTDIAGGLEALFRCKGARERFLLTDGEDDDQGAILARVRQAQKVDGAPLHCIGVEMSHRGADLLRDIAEEGNGEVRFVDSAELAGGGGNDEEEEEDGWGP